MEYLFAHWDELRKKLRARSVALFLDYDGTLAPISETPGSAAMPAAAREVVRTLSRCLGVTVTVVSGRELRDVREKVGLRDIVYVGNHGLELMGPRIRFRSPVSARYMRALKKIRSELEKEIGALRGVLLEDKGLTLCMHYRRAAPRDALAAKTAFRKAVILHSVREEVDTRSGKKVLEVRPAFDWDKGTAVFWLLCRRGFIEGGESPVPVYIGDDATDEDAFRAIGNRGVTVLVGYRKCSRARYWVRDTGEVVRFLRMIAELKGGEDA